MSKSHQPYAAEFRQQTIELVSADGNPETLSREFGRTAQSIRDWASPISSDTDNVMGISAET